MKKLTICILMIICMAAFAGCGDRQASKADVEFLQASEYWWFYDEVTGESEKMSFNEDFTFYWGCECGEPVGDSDCYELYDYDKETQTIKLYNDYDDYSMEMKVLDYSDYHLLLEQNGEIKDYTYWDSEIDVENSEEYFKDYNMHSWIVDNTDTEAVIGPMNYDGDVEYPDNAMKTYPLADNIIFYELDIRKVISDEDETCDVTYRELTREEGIQHMDGGYGFFWFNDDMEIEKITYYGELINWV